MSGKCQADTGAGAFLAWATSARVLFPPFPAAAESPSVTALIRTVRGIRSSVCCGRSSSHEGSAVEAFFDKERERYRGQLERYRRLFAALEDWPIRMGLYFPLLGWFGAKSQRCRAAVESGVSVV